MLCNTNDPVEIFEQLNAYQAVTIDSDNSIDLDDAFWVRQCEDGCFELLVFITNTSKVINRESRHYLLAKDRVISTYHAKGLRDPMLSMNVTEKLSLNEAKGHDVIVFDIKVSANGESMLQAVTQGKADNICRLNYQLEQKDGVPDVSAMLESAQMCASILFEQRLKRGSVAFADLDNGFYCNEEGVLIDVELDDIHAQIMIQEFMIATNSLFAEYAKEAELPIIYRNHSAPKAIGQREDFITELINLYLASPNSRITGSAMPRALYNTFSRGHFGLDLPSYATVTSPIRRFADLHNMIILNNHLSNLPNQTTEESVCDSINTRLDELRDSKSTHLKSRDEGRALRKFNTKGSDLTATDLKFVVKSLPEGAKANKLTVAISEFLKNTPSTELIRAVWVHGVNSDENHTKKLGSAMLSLNGVCVSAMREMISQSKANWESQEESILSCGGISVTSSNNSEKQAFTTATKQWICLRFDVVEIETKEKLQSSTGSTNKNWKGDLLELCTKCKLPMPIFTVSKTGDVHAPTFICEATVTASGQKYKSEGVGSKLKLAEQAAAQDLFIKLDSIKQIKPNKHVKSKTQSTGNSKSTLNMFCQQNQLAAPIFQHRSIGEDHVPVFSSTCTVVFNGGNHSGTGSGSSKKQADQLSATEVLGKIEAYN